MVVLDVSLLERDVAEKVSIDALFQSKFIWTRYAWDVQNTSNDNRVALEARILKIHDL